MEVNEPRQRNPDEQLLDWVQWDDKEIYAEKIIYEVMISTFPRIPEILVEGNSCNFISYFRVSVLF